MMLPDALLLVRFNCEAVGMRMAHARDRPSGAGIILTEGPVVTRVLGCIPEIVLSRSGVGLRISISRCCCCCRWWRLLLAEVTSPSLPPSPPTHPAPQLP